MRAEDKRAPHDRDLRHTTSSKGPLAPATADEVLRDLSNNNTAAALQQLAGFGSHVCMLFAAVTDGATLVVSGPDPLRGGERSGTSLGGRGAPRFGASMESATGARYAQAHGNDLADVLQQLVAEWNKP